MFEVLFSHINEKVALTPEEHDRIKTYFTPKKLRKRQYLLQDGEVCRYLAFVEKGLLRSYNVDNKGLEHMIQFAWEGWWIADMFSFFSGETSTYNIDAIEDAELLMITLANFEEMMLKIPKWNVVSGCFFKATSYQKNAGSLVPSATQPKRSI